VTPARRSGATAGRGISVIGWVQGPIVQDLHHEDGASAVHGRRSEHWSLSLVVAWLTKLSDVRRTHCTHLDHDSHRHYQFD
jgi:hypothetical protein